MNSKILFALLFSLILAVSVSAETQRAYFKVKDLAGFNSIASYARHSFPSGNISIEAPSEAIDGLKHNPHLEFIGYANKWYIEGSPAGELGAVGGIKGKPGTRPCVLSDYGLPQVWYGVKQVYNNFNITSTSGGAGVNVAVLDTGAIKHFDLASNIKVCLDATGRGIKNGCTDRDGHGTHVAGIIAANSGSDGKGIYGVAPQSNLWIYKVCGTYCWSDDVARAINDATARGTNVISMSFGGTGLAADEKAALDNAYAHGVLLVAAAGNAGPAYNTIEYPGAYDKVMAVAAIDDQYATANFSSRGINDGDYIIEEREVEVAAGGVNILSTYKDGCYAYYWGTSQATPHVSGLAAKLWQGSGTTTRTYLQNRAMLWDLDVLGDDPATGFGLPTVLN
ncbi:MAG: S8 family serine peptidase [Candidatus Diapherotrites archaeon]